jgi:hypothetical protein
MMLESAGIPADRVVMHPAPEPSHDQGQRVTPLSPAWILALVLAVAAGAVAILAGWAVDFVACESPSEACERKDLARAQLFVALACGGLLWGFVAAVAGRRLRLARVLLGLAIPVYLAWALLNDAAVHGWGSDMTLVP